MYGIPVSPPSGAVSDGKTRVTLAVLAGHTTFGALRQQTGLSGSTIHFHLRDLRKMGLVDWVDGKRGTLHPLVRRVR